MEPGAENSGGIPPSKSVENTTTAEHGDAARRSVRSEVATATRREANGMAAPGGRCGRSATGKEKRSIARIARYSSDVNRPPHPERLHREVFRQPELVHLLRRPAIALFHPLPELALIHARERRAILLALVFEDGADLEPQLFLGERHQQIGFGH